MLERKKYLLTNFLGSLLIHVKKNMVKGMPTRVANVVAHHEKLLTQ